MHSYDTIAFITSQSDIQDEHIIEHVLGVEQAKKRVDNFEEAYPREHFTAYFVPTTWTYEYTGE